MGGQLGAGHRGGRGGFRPLIGGGFHADISDDAAASRGK